MQTNFAKDFSNDARSHFPLLIEYTQDQKKVTVNTPDEIEGGVAFKVLKTRYKPFFNSISTKITLPYSQNEARVD